MLAGKPVETDDREGTFYPTCGWRVFSHALEEKWYRAINSCHLLSSSFSTSRSAPPTMFSQLAVGEPGEFVLLHCMYCGFIMDLICHRNRIKMGPAHYLDQVISSGLPTPGLHS